MKTPAFFAVLLLAAAARALEPAPDAAQLAFFEKKIRPVLADKCYKCHSEGADKIKGGLVLDTREGIRRGGDSGPAVVPGNLKESLLIEAVRYANSDTAMPPEKKGGKLPEDVIRDLETWVGMGAPDPREGAAKTARQTASEDAKKWWAFQPIQKPAPARPRDAAWARTPLDGFVRAGLEAKSLQPVGDADPATLLRRLSFDLTGLPPSPAEIGAFLKETRLPGATQAALEKTVDTLLASPRFGERWGRHWLDVARFAESSGKDVNVAFPQAWRYRDYVIGAFNADKPFDQFIREQVAGDLLPAADERQRAGQLVATGFLAIGAKGLNEQNPRQFALDLADEQIDTLSEAFLGLTIACARCHDHKFDPIPQRDYYAMAGIFLSTDTRYGTAQSVQNRHPSELLDLPAGAGVPVYSRTMGAEERKQKEARLADLRDEQREILLERLAERNGGKLPPGVPAPTPKSRPARPGVNSQQRGLILVAQIGQLETELKGFDAGGQVKPQAMGVCDLPVSALSRGFGQGGGSFEARFRERLKERFGGRPPELAKIGDSALYTRGDVEKPGEKVPRGFISLLAQPGAAAIPGNTSGRRELADQLASASNPLTARVMANRVWHWLFGQGLVTSTDNFGTTGQKPSNPALLDYLAGRLIENGWSVKKLVREIVLSRTYQLASTFEEKNFAADPENALLWRMSQRRLDAECVRDAMLAVSGQLDLTPPMGSIIAKAGEGPIAGPRLARGVGEEAIVNAAAPQRSVYLPVARDVLPDALAVFDFAEPTLVSGVRETTNVPAQALYLLNSPFVASQARALARKIMDAFPGGTNGGAVARFDERLNFAYWLVFSRPPDPAETRAAAAFLTRFPADWSRSEKSPAGLRDAAGIDATWTSLCRALFSTAEFRYLN